MRDSCVIRVAAIGTLVASVVGCTAQDRYGAVYRENSRECDLKTSEVERERCREQLAPASYDEYERLRASAMKRAGSRSGEQSRAGIHSDMDGS